MGALKGLSPAAVGAPRGEEFRPDFPVPFVRRTALPRRGRGRERAARRRTQVGMVNAMLAMWNLQFLGRPALAYSTVMPTAAQSRVQQQATQFVGRFLRGGTAVSGERAIQDFLRQPAFGYGRGHSAKPIGLRAGVPEQAGLVNLERELYAFSPTMSKQVAEPTSLLLDPARRPVDMPWPFSRLCSTYPAFVKKCKEVGLQTVRPRKRIFKVRGRALMNGAFAVAKSEGRTERSRPWCRRTC